MSNQQNTIHLDSCPFCGNKDITLEQDSIGCRIICYTCGIGHIERNWTVD